MDISRSSPQRQRITNPYLCSSPTSLPPYLSVRPSLNPHLLFFCLCLSLSNCLSLCILMHFTQGIDNTADHTGLLLDTSCKAIQVLLHGAVWVHKVSHSSHIRPCACINTISILCLYLYTKSHLKIFSLTLCVFVSVSIHKHTHTQTRHMAEESRLPSGSSGQLCQGGGGGWKRRHDPPWTYTHINHTHNPCNGPHCPPHPTALSVRALLIQSAHIHMQICRGHNKNSHHHTHIHTHTEARYLVGFGTKVATQEFWKRKRVSGK